jgi:hypothetical protein
VLQSQQLDGGACGSDGEGDKVFAASQIGVQGEGASDCDHENAAESRATQDDSEVDR